MFALLVCGLLAADPMPANVKKYFADVEKAKSYKVKLAEAAVAETQRDLANPKKTQKEFLGEVLKQRRDQLDAAKAADVTNLVLMPLKPKVGTIGYIGEVRISSRIDNDSAIVELNEIVQASSKGEPVVRVSPTIGKVMVRGENLFASADAKKVSLNATFEVTGATTEKDKLPIIEKFDASKWQDKK